MSMNKIKTISRSGQLTSGLQVGGHPPVLHRELGRVVGVLESGVHLSAHFPVAASKRERELAG